MSSHTHRPLSTLPATVIGPQLSKGWKVSNWMWVSVEWSVSFWAQPPILTTWTARSRLQRSSFSASSWCSCEELLLPTLSEASGVALGGWRGTRRHGEARVFLCLFLPPLLKRATSILTRADKISLTHCAAPRLWLEVIVLLLKAWSVSVSCS